MGRIAERIGGIWKRVGLELGLPLYKLNTIEADNPGRNFMAAVAMLSTWKDINENFSRSKLKEAINSAQTSKGMYLVFYFHVIKSITYDNLLAYNWNNNI